MTVSQHEVHNLIFRPIAVVLRGACADAATVTAVAAQAQIDVRVAYALRPPLAQERLHQTSEGEIWLTLRHRWRMARRICASIRWSCCTIARPDSPL
jgi:hypothetical protein